MILILLAALLQQDAHVLKWEPPEGRVIVSKIKLVSRGNGLEGVLEAESEIRIQKKKVDVVPIQIQFTRFSMKEEWGPSRSFTYDRGKEPVLTGLWEDEEKAMHRVIAKSIDGRVSSHGNMDGSGRQDTYQQLFGLGVVHLGLSPKRVRAGSTWECEIDVPMVGGEFNGNFKFKLEELTAAQARISVKAVPIGAEARDKKRTWEGGGTIVYSMKDKLISEYKFRLAQKDEAGKEVKSVEQELSVELKP